MSETTNQPTFVHRIREWLPEGRELPLDAWNARHRFILGFIFVHAVGLSIFGLARGWSPAIALGEGAAIGLVGLVASIPRLSRKFRSAAAALACATSSAVLTQFWGGYIEGHFHYFVIVALIALYQDWVPFLLAIVFVAVDHGLIGTLMPTWVYNHPAAIAHPWTWAVVHATLVLGEAVVLVISWKTSEQSRARADLVLSAAGEGIIGLDRGGKITFANPAAAQMLGSTSDGLYGKPITSALATTVGSGATLQIGALDGGATMFEGHGQMVIHQAGGDTPVDWNLNPVLAHNVPVGAVLTLVDASERVRAEREHSNRLQQMVELEQLKEMDQFKTVFINTAAHELHTPLTPLRLNVFALKEGHKGELNAEQLSTVDVLDRNVERLSQLVEDVLNVARLQANRMSVERKRIDLGAAVHTNIDSFQESARHGNIALDATIASGIQVDADERRLGQVVYNLLDNAIKFTPAGGRIHVRVGREAGSAFIRVTDTGVGLRSSDIAKLFQPFSQAHSHMERTRAGSGLGLFISRGIIELHGGRIECTSPGPGKGAEFTVRLPPASAVEVPAPQ